jgi:hypothetical protein
LVLNFFGITSWKGGKVWVIETGVAIGVPGRCIRSPAMIAVRRQRSRSSLRRGAPSIVVSVSRSIGPRDTSVS